MEATVLFLKDLKAFNNTSCAIDLRLPGHGGIYIPCYIYYFYISLLIINSILTILSLIFGIVSWVLIPKWRQFQNYVFANLMIAGIFIQFCFYFYSHHYDSHILILLPRTVLTNWMLVCNMMLYMDIVKAFNNDVNRKYLKVNVFAWGIPCVKLVIIYAIEQYYEGFNTVRLSCVIVIVTLVCNNVIYLTCVYTIVRLALSGKGSRRAMFSTFLIVFIAGIPSGLSSLLPVLLVVVMSSEVVAYITMVLMSMLTHTLGIVIFLCGKIHREVWAEYLRRRRAMQMTN